MLKLMTLVALVVRVLLTGALAQEPTTEASKDPFAPIRALEGDWHGDISGKLGTGTGVRHIEFILDGQYLLSRHASVRVPQEASPEGDYHRELAVWSYDSTRQKLVLREFMVEGFILQSVCEPEGKMINCEAEEVESGPGWQAKLQLEIKSPYEYIERFWLAEPGAELELYFTNRWTRIPKLQ